MLTKWAFDAPANSTQTWRSSRPADLARLAYCSFPKLRRSAKGSDYCKLNARRWIPELVSADARKFGPAEIASCSTIDLSVGLDCDADVDMPSCSAVHPASRNNLRILVHGQWRCHGLLPREVSSALIAAAAVPLLSNFSQFG